MNLLVAIVAALIISLAEGRPDNWQEINYDNFSPKFVDYSPRQDFAERFSDINPWLLSVIYSFAEFHGFDIYVTSHYRDGDSGMHGIGGAIDAFFTDYTGMSRCEKLDYLFEVYILWKEFLWEMGYRPYSGLAFYLDAEHTPFLHIDIRLFVDSDGANWSRVEGNYVGVEEGLAAFREECNED